MLRPLRPDLAVFVLIENIQNLSLGFRPIEVFGLDSDIATKISDKHKWAFDPYDNLRITKNICLGQISLEFDYTYLVILYQ